MTVEKMTGSQTQAGEGQRNKKIVEQINFSFSVLRAWEPGFRAATVMDLAVTEVVMFLTKGEVEFFAQLPENNFGEKSLLIEEVHADEAEVESRQRSQGTGLAAPAAGNDLARNHSSSDSLLAENVSNVKSFRINIVLVGSFLGLQSVTLATFAEFEINSARFGYTSFADGGWSVDLTSESVLAYSVDDESHRVNLLLGPARSPVSRTRVPRRGGGATEKSQVTLFEPASPPAETTPVEPQTPAVTSSSKADLPPFLSLNARAMAGGSFKVNLNLHEPKSFIIFHAYYKIMDFVDLESSRPASPAPTTPTKPKAIPSAPATPGRVAGSPPAVASPPAARPPTTKFSFSVVNPEVTLVEDLTELNSPSIVLGFTLAGNYTKTEETESCAMSFQQLQIFSCLLGVEGSTMSIVDPFSTTIDYQKETVEGIEAVSVEVNADEVLARLAYDDVRIVLEVLERMPAAARSRKGNVATSALADTPDLITALNTEPGALRLPQQQRLHVTIQQGYFIGVDDSTINYIPLLEVQASNLSVEIRDWSATAKLRSMAKLSCDVFNRKLAAWEPLLEPWLAQVNVKYAASPFYLYSELVSTEKADLTISQEMLTLERRTLANWTSKKKKARSKESMQARQEYCPYLLRNETGVTVTFATTEHTDARVLEAGSQADFKFEDDTKRTTVRGEKRLKEVVDKHTILASLQGSSSRPKLIGVDKVGLTSFHFHTPEGRITTVLADVTLEEGDSRKVVTLRSPFVLKNDTDHAIIVTSEKPENPPLGTIKPLEHLALPATFPHNVSLFLQPKLVGSQNQWTDGDRVFTRHSGERVVLTSSPERPEGNLIRYSVLVTKDRVDSKTQRYLLAPLFPPWLSF